MEAKKHSREMLSRYILTHLELELDLPYLKMYFTADRK